MVNLITRRLFLRNAATAATTLALFPLVGSHASERAWDEFRDRLTEVLPALSEHEFIIIQRQGTNQFVQFMSHGRDGMRAEAVSNGYLSAATQLSGASIAGLLAMGWRVPTYLPTTTLDSQEPKTGSPNFFLDIATPVPHGQLAALAVRTLRETYGVRQPEHMEYMAMSSSIFGESVRFPSLGIKRWVRTTERKGILSVAHQ